MRNRQRSHYLTSDERWAEAAPKPRLQRPEHRSKRSRVVSWRRFRRSDGTLWRSHRRGTPGDGCMRKRLAPLCQCLCILLEDLSWDPSDGHSLGISGCVNEDKLRDAPDLVLLYLLSPLPVVNVKHNKVDVAAIPLLDLVRQGSQLPADLAPVCIEFNNSWPAVGKGSLERHAIRLQLGKCWNCAAQLCCSEEPSAGCGG
mmetsp:Transcript_35961/g.85285  ORF Transcript_35961/g.85285 Transcript_35961/m.85285 type:complete len:200 (-) Transcript_35961:318-917(-)